MGVTFHEIDHREVNHALINRIRHEDSDNALKEIYINYRDEFLAWAISHYLCETEEAKEAFQQSVVIFYENIIHEKVTEITCEVKTYLFGIGKNKIRELVRKKGKLMLYDEDLDYPKWELYYNDMKDGYEEKLKKIATCIEKLGDPCKTILEQYYYHKKCNQEIADMLNYKKNSTLRNRKYKCLKRLKKIIKSFDTL